MSDFSNTRVVNFTGKKDEWFNRREKSLARARCSGINDLLLEKGLMTKVDEEISEKTEDCKNKLGIMDLNELAHTESVLLINVRSSNRKVVFNMVKECKSKENTVGNAAIALDSLK